MKPLPKTAKEALDRVLLDLTGCPKDCIRMRDACEGIIITGSPGSGKSSTAFKNFALELLDSGAGGCVLASKREEPETWMEYARLTGRERDVIRFSPEGDHCFDPLQWVFNIPGRGAKDVEAVIDAINTLLAVGHPHSSGGNSDRYWELETERLNRATVKALDLAGEPISITTMNDFIESLPKKELQYLTSEWKETSYCSTVMGKINARLEDLTPSEMSDCEMVTRFVCQKWATDLHERERGIVAATWYGMADRFLYQPFRRLLSGGVCTFTPESATRDGKIVLVDFPILETGQETSRFINCMIKLFMQYGWLRRNFEKEARIVFLAADEQQMFLLPKGRDNFFSQSCRSAGVVVLGATQNLSQIAEQFGEQQIGAKTRAWMGNVAVKIAFQQNDISTNEFYSSQIGKEWRPRRQLTDSMSRDLSFSVHEELLPLVEPDEFSRLTKPDGDNPFAEAIVYVGGRLFEGTKDERHRHGYNYLRTLFSR